MGIIYGIKPNKPQTVPVSAPCSPRAWDLCDLGKMLLELQKGQLPGTWFCTVWVPQAGPAAPGPGHGVTVRVLTGAVQPEQHARAPLTPYDISPPPGRFKPSSFISAGPANSQIARLCRYVLTH